MYYAYSFFYLKELDMDYTNGRRRPVLLIFSDMFDGSKSRRVLHSLLDIARAAEIKLIVVGKDMCKEEVIHKRSTEDLVFRTAMAVAYATSEKILLRKPFKKYFSEVLGHDFDNSIVVSDKHRSINKNIAVTSSKKDVDGVVKEILDRIGVVETLKECIPCRGTGAYVTFDQCGCVESEYPCSYCSGHKKVKSYHIRQKDEMDKQNV